MEKRKRQWKLLGFNGVHIGVKPLANGTPFRGRARILRLGVLGFRVGCRV